MTKHQTRIGALLETLMATAMGLGSFGVIASVVARVGGLV